MHYKNVEYNLYCNFMYIERCLIIYGEFSDRDRVRIDIVSQYIWLTKIPMQLR